MIQFLEVTERELNEHYIVFASIFSYLHLRSFGDIVTNFGTFAIYFVESINKKEPK